MGYVVVACGCGDWLMWGAYLTLALWCNVPSISPTATATASLHLALNL